MKICFGHFLSSLLLLCLTAGAFQTPANASSIVVWDNGLPDYSNARVNDSRYPIYLNHADDFTLATSQTITGLTWLGAYKDGNNLPDGDDNFRVQFFQIVSGTPSITPVADLVIGNATRTATGNTIPFAYPVYSYVATLPGTPLALGNYLLAIRNEARPDNDKWMWATRDVGGNGYYQMLGAGTPWGHYTSTNFAFTISAEAAAPEPGVMGLLMVGAGFFFARRVRTT